MINSVVVDRPYRRPAESESRHNDPCWFQLPVPGKHAAASYTFVGPRVTVGYACVSNSFSVGVVTVPISNVTYAVATDKKEWLPSGDKKAASSFQASYVLPNLCSGSRSTRGRGVRDRHHLDASDHPHRPPVAPADGSEQGRVEQRGLHQANGLMLAAPEVHPTAIFVLLGGKAADNTVQRSGQGRAV